MLSTSERSPMHGLVNRALQCFLRDTFGTEVWRDIAQAAGAPPDGFEPMLRYPPDLTLAVIAAAARLLDRPREALMEDLGTYLVSNPGREGLRRLLRFGGVEFADFLYSLDDLPGRGRLAVPDLDLPQLELEDAGNGHFALTVHGPWPDFAPVMVGVLRAMADDYGALALAELVDDDGPDGARRIAIDLFDARFAAGRRFDLSAGST